MKTWEYNKIYYVFEFFYYVFEYIRNRRIEECRDLVLGNIIYKQNLSNFVVKLGILWYKIYLWGIRGTYVYACDKNLREYLRKYIDEQK